MERRESDLIHTLIVNVAIDFRISGIDDMIIIPVECIACTNRRC